MPLSTNLNALSIIKGNIKSFYYPPKKIVDGSYIVKSLNIYCKGKAACMGNINSTIIYASPFKKIDGVYIVKSLDINCKGTAKGISEINSTVVYAPPNNITKVKYNVKAIIEGSTKTNFDMVIGGLNRFSLLGKAAAKSSIISTSLEYTGIISGIVTNNGEKVSNAKIYLIDTQDDVIHDVALTNKLGYYEFTKLNPNKEYHVVVQYEAEGTKYNAESLPFIEPAL